MSRHLNFILSCVTALILGATAITIYATAAERVALVEQESRVGP